METERFDAFSKFLAARGSRRQTMGRVAGIGAALLTVAGMGGEGALAAPSPVATPRAADIAGNFSATIYQGPDRGLTLQGLLELTGGQGGRLSGRLTPASGAAVPVSGQLTGTAISLVFYLPGGKQVFGVGAIGQDPDSKRWVAGGPLVGPGPGDSGDWSICFQCDPCEPFTLCPFGFTCHQIPCPKTS